MCENIAGHWSKILTTYNLQGIVGGVGQGVGDAVGGITGGLGSGVGKIGQGNLLGGVGDV